MLQSSKLAVLLMLLAVLGACSSTGTADYDVGERNKPENLQIPPDMTLPQGSDRLDIPVIDISQQNTSATRRSSRRDTALLPGSEDARLHTDGDVRWLEIDASPEVIWGEIQGFFRNQGFKITYQDPQLGIVQTGWQENQVYLPSSWFSRFMNNISSSGLMDSYRARIERTGDKNKTRLYLTHRGMEEVALNEDSGSETVVTHWQPRASDPELEAEMMLRFLEFRGTKEKKAKQIMSHKPAAQRALLKQVDGAQVLVVYENFARTWRRVGLAIDRLGLIVEDRNRSKGLYYLKLSEDFLKHHEQKKGLFASLFGGQGDKQPLQFILKVQEQDNTSQISIHQKDGKLADSASAEVLLKPLSEQLK